MIPQILKLEEQWASVISPVSDSRIPNVGAQQETTRSGRDKARPTSSYSGRFLVRMPSELHEQLARAAEQDDITKACHLQAVLAREPVLPENAPRFAHTDLMRQSDDVGVCKSGNAFAEKSSRMYSP